MSKSGKKGVFLTGGSGNALRPFMRYLLANSDYDLRALTHQETSLTSLLNEFGHYGSRFKPIRGDVSEPGIIHDTAIRKDVIENTHIIINGAGNVKFNDTSINLAETNIEGVENMIEMAEDCKKHNALEQFVHIGTVYTADMRVGTTYEGPMVERENFISEYERTKYEGECKLEEAIAEGRFGDTKVKRLRLGIVVDHSQVTFNQYMNILALSMIKFHYRENGIDKFLDAWNQAELQGENYQKLNTRLIGMENADKLFITPEEVAKQIYHLTEHDAGKDSVYHIVGSNPLKSSDICRVMNRVMPFLNFSFAGKKIDKSQSHEKWITMGTEPFREYSILSDLADNAKAREVLSARGHQVEVMTPDIFHDRIVKPHADNYLRNKDYLEKALKSKTKNL